MGGRRSFRRVRLGGLERARGQQQRLKEVGVSATVKREADGGLMGLGPVAERDLPSYEPCQETALRGRGGPGRLDLCG